MAERLLLWFSSCKDVELRRLPTYGAFKVAGTVELPWLLHIDTHAFILQLAPLTENLNMSSEALAPTVRFLNWG